MTDLKDKDTQLDKLSNTLSGVVGIGTAVVGLLRFGVEIVKVAVDEGKRAIERRKVDRIRNRRSDDFR